MVINYVDADETINKLREQGVECYWDNFTLCVFKPHRSAMRNRQGVLRNGVWGFENRYEVQDDGTWHLPDFQLIN